MSSPIHRHNPYQQALPVGYQTVTVDTQATSPYVDQQQAYYPAEVEVHTHRRSGAPAPQQQQQQQSGAPNFAHGVQHGYHAAPQQLQQQQYQAYYSSYDTSNNNGNNGYNHHQSGGYNHGYDNYNQTNGCEVDFSCGVPVAACFPAGVMDSLIDSAAKATVGDGADDDDEDVEECLPGLAKCITPPSNLQQGSGPHNAGAPPVYSDFASITKTQHAIALQTQQESQANLGDSTTSSGPLGGSTTTTPPNGDSKSRHESSSDASVMKTCEKVIRVELNGRVPYIHFPPVAEMAALVNEAKQQQVLDDEEMLLRNPTMVGPDGKLKKSYLPVFFGQVIFSTTQTHLSWLLLHLTGLLPTAVSNHSPGCFTCYFTTMADCNSVLSLNKRLLFDNDGVWVAQNPHQTDLVFKSVNHWRQKQQQGGQQQGGNNAAASRLPRGAMVVELPMHGGGGGGGGGGAKNHNNRAGGNRGASRMR